MSFAFPTVEPETWGEAPPLRTPLSKYLESEFQFGWHDSALNSLMRINEMAGHEDSRLLQPEEANSSWAVGDLKFEAPVREDVARIMNRRKRDEMDRQYFLSRGSSIGRFLPGMAAAMIGGMLNPVDLAVAFIPFVGEGAMAAKLARSGAGPLRRALARGLITREALGEVVPALSPKLMQSMIQASGFIAVDQVPNLIASAQDHADFGGREYLMSMGFNAALVGALHPLGRIFKKMSPDTHEAIIREKMNAFLKDEEVDASKYVMLDERALWEAAKFDEARAARDVKVDAEAVKQQLWNEHGWKVNPDTPAAFIAPTGEIWVGSTHWSAEGLKFLDKNPESIRGYHLIDGRVVAESAMSDMTGLPQADLTTELFMTPHDDTFMAKTEYDRQNLLMETGLSHAEATKKVLEEREERAKVNFFKNPDNQAKLDAAVQRNAQEITERARQEHDQFGEFGRLRRQEIDRQIAEGRVLRPDEVEEHQNPATFDGSSDAKIDESIKDLKPDKPFEYFTPRMAEAPKPQVESIQAAIECLLRKMI